jgi:uncharacterized membrane protein YhaH (DUF805 family)
VSNIYSPPSADVSNIAVDDATYEPKLFSLTGRIGRLRMVAYNLSLGMIAMVGAFAVVFLGVALHTAFLIILGALVFIPMLVLSIGFSVRRLNDLNHSGWWVLISFIPVLGWLYGLYVLFAPGSKGSNEYGAAPAQNPTWVKVCALILPVLFIGLMIAAMSTGVYQSYLERASSGVTGERSL